MTISGAELRGLAGDLKIAILFATRIPLPQAAPITGGEIARASWALPIAGLLVGLIGALTYWLAWSLGVPPFAAAGLALSATLLATGALHEDGLADTFDGLGGGADRERRLAIMRDSRLGTYGACALAMSLLLRVGTLASLGAPVRVALALIAAHGAARALLPAFMSLVPPARTEGLSADAGQPTRASIIVAALLGILSLLALGPIRALVAPVLLLAMFAIVRHQCIKLVGGQTGDVAGALEQIGEIMILLCAAAI